MKKHRFLFLNEKQIRETVLAIKASSHQRTTERQREYLRKLAKIIEEQSK